VAATVSTGAILFTDMVGSTELRSRLGDDRADLLRKHHDDLLADVVASHRGEVLRWTGDGIKAAFATSSDAVAAAVDMQRRVAAYGAEAEAVAPFEVRIGLGAGEVVIDDDDHHGVAVIEAARLEAMARPGEILATDVVRMLGHRRANVMFEELGERTLKGLDRPVLVHRVIDLTVGVVPPVPRVLAGDHLLPLVGRERQLGILTDAWHRARSGEAALDAMRR
jgi:adenylate cyclase